VLTGGKSFHGGKAKWLGVHLDVLDHLQIVALAGGDCGESVPRSL
jgi:hypothetical protein